MSAETRQVVDSVGVAWQIALVRGLRHRVNGQHSCRCEECRAIVAVCALANEAVAMKQARRKPPLTGPQP
jgi:hypothetical protein